MPTAPRRHRSLPNFFESAFAGFSDKMKLSLMKKGSETNKKGLKIAQTLTAFQTKVRFPAERLTTIFSRGKIIFKIIHLKI
jgi:hypothetical protein